MFIKNINRLRNHLCEYILTSRIHCNNYSTNNAAAAATNAFVPVQIDVPWGKIEGKLWGTGDKQPILAVHGWMDNAGSFDNLAPALLAHSPILAIDLPGHGISSWLPPGVPYTVNFYAQALRRVVKHQGWPSVKLLGHSLGGITCYCYASLYPDETRLVVSIDSLGVRARRSAALHAAYQAHAIDALLAMERRYGKDAPSYDEATVIRNWMRASEFGSLDEATVRILMRRGCAERPDGRYAYTRDPRLKLGGFDECRSAEQVRELTETIGNCPYLAIRATRHGFAEVADYWRRSSADFKRSNVHYYEKKVDGTHHLHMQNAAKVAEAILPFLAKFDG